MQCSPIKIFAFLRGNRLNATGNGITAGRNPERIARTKELDLKFSPIANSNLQAHAWPILKTVVLWLAKNTVYPCMARKAVYSVTTSADGMLPIRNILPHEELRFAVSAPPSCRADFLMLDL
jgi:hypothetical protein